MINSENEIELKEKNTTPVLTKEYRDLLEIDSELNKCMYYTELVPNKSDQENFIRLYNSVSITEGIPSIAKGKFFDVTFYARLMLKDKKIKLTPTKLENCVLVIAVPIGENENGEVTYYFTEYNITKEDKNALGTKSKGKVKSSATVKERFNYFENLIIEYVKEVRKGLSNVSKISLLPIAKNVSTWIEFESNFIKKYDFVPEKFDSSTWCRYDSVKFDGRTIDEFGHILPIVVEYHENILNEEDLYDNSNFDEREIDDAEIIMDVKEVDNSDLVDDDYSLGENTYVNVDMDNKFIKLNSNEEESADEDDEKNKFINEYNTKFFKFDEVLDIDEEEEEVFHDELYVPLSFKEITKNISNDNKINVNKKYKLTSSVSFKIKEIPHKDEEIKGSIPETFEAIKKNIEIIKNEKKNYKLSSAHKFSDTIEEDGKIKLKNSVPFNDGIEA